MRGGLGGLRDGSYLLKGQWLWSVSHCRVTSIWAEGCLCLDGGMKKAQVEKD